MIGSLIGKIELMSLAEGLHTAAFTTFVLCGVVCCFKRSDKASQQRPLRRAVTATAKTPAHHARRRRTMPATARVASRPRQLSLPLGRVAA
jgi:hypothetical protein